MFIYVDKLITYVGNLNELYNRHLKFQSKSTGGFKAPIWMFAQQYPFCFLVRNGLRK